VTLDDWVLLASVLLVLRWAWPRLKRRTPRAVDPEDATRLNFFSLNWTGVESPDGCDWQDRLGMWPKLSCKRRGLTAQVQCDPTCRERICLTTLGFWRSVAKRPSARPLGPTPSELFEAIEAMLQTIVAKGLTPRLVLLEPDERFEFWSQWLAQQAPRLCPHQREQMTDFAWKLVQLLPFLDRKPFGLELSTRLAASLQRHPDGMFYWHPYYCGHGLRMKAGDYLLAEKDDLEYPPLATWSEEQSFIEAVASWSDYVCSGADPNASLFQATSEFYLDNQRITRARIEEFIENFPAE